MRNMNSTAVRENKYFSLISQNTEKNKQGQLLWNNLSSGLIYPRKGETRVTWLVQLVEHLTPDLGGQFKYHVGRRAYLILIKKKKGEKKLKWYNLQDYITSISCICVPGNTQRVAPISFVPSSPNLNVTRKRINNKEYAHSTDYYTTIKMNEIL